MQRISGLCIAAAFLVLPACFLAGCGSSEEPGSPAAGMQRTETGSSESANGDMPPPPQQGAEKAAAAEQKPQPQDVYSLTESERTNVSGRWLLIVTHQGIDRAAGLLEIASAEGSNAPADDKGDRRKGGATLVGPDPLLQAVFGDADLARMEIDDETVQLFLESADGGADFRGRLKNGLIRGNVLFNSGACRPARLVPMQAEALQELPGRKKVRGRQEIAGLAEADDPLAAVRGFAEEYPDSPAVMDACIYLLAQAEQLEINEATARKLAEFYIESAGRWGIHQAQSARLNLALALANTEYLPELALEYLEQAESQPTPEMLEAWRPEIVLVRHKTDIAEARRRAERARRMLKGGNKQEALRMLRELEQEHPFEPLTVYTLARHARAQGRTDDALALFARIAALPSMEADLLQNSSLSEDADFRKPSDTVREMWRRKHRSAEGLDEYLDEAYEKHVARFADAPVESRAEEAGNRVVLCELFTGATCRPCIAADVATEGLQHTYPPSQVIVLRYHQHIPGPDALANEDSEGRFYYYGPRGTPAIRVNGTEPPAPAGGLLLDAPRVYQQLRSVIDETLKETTDVALDLSAHAEDGRLHVTAAADGLDNPAETHRLRLVLAENKLHFPAYNGIRVHEMTVRAMPGGPDGIAPENGRFRFSTSINLAAFKQRLLDYLTDYEQGAGHSFAAKPLDLRDLSLVAFVQNDATQEVLQAAVIPVTGRLHYPAVAAVPPESPNEGDGTAPAPRTGPAPDVPESGKTPQGPQLMPPNVNR